MRFSRINATVFLTIALPLFAVLASVGTAIIALSSGDPPLPGEYHWEGDKLDRDFARSRRAAELNLNAVLDLQPRNGVCHLTLTIDGTPPPAVDVALIHVSQPALDRRLRFLRTAEDSRYSAPCAALPSTGWHVELSDPANSWRFRTDASGELDNIILSSGPSKKNTA